MPMRIVRDIDADIDAKKRNDFFAETCIRIRQEHVADEHAKPLRRNKRNDEGNGGGLRQTTPETSHQRRRRKRQIAWRPAGSRLVIQQIGHRTQAARAIDVLQRDAGETWRLAHHGNKTRGEQ